MQIEMGEKVDIDELKETIAGYELNPTIVYAGEGSTQVVIKTIKEWSKPGMSEREWKQNVDSTLTDNSERIESLEEGNRIICKALLAIMSHEINGNSIDKLQKAYDDMNDYLVDK